MINVKKICKIEISKNKINKNNRLSVQNMKIWRFWGAGESGRRGVGSVGHSFNWPQWVQALLLSHRLRHVALQHSVFPAQTWWTIRRWMPCISLRFLCWSLTSLVWGVHRGILQLLVKHRAILYNEAEVFSLSITNPNGLPMLAFDWLIHSSIILASCHRIFFVPVFCGWEINFKTKIRKKYKPTAKVIYFFYGNMVILQPVILKRFRKINISCCCTLAAKIQSTFYERNQPSALSRPLPF